MLHPHQGVYGASEDKVDYLIDAPEVIINDEDRYAMAFHDPIWVGDANEGVIEIPTTATGEGCFYPEL